jgi:heparanase
VWRLVSVPLLYALGVATISLPSHARPALREPPGRNLLAFAGDRAAARIDEKFLSFAIDTAQVVGSRFWAPPGQGEGLLDTARVGRFDFDRPRLRRLAAALAPAYLRIGGTDADWTRYHLGDGPPPPGSPKARAVLTRQRWDEVNHFAQDLGLRLVFTLNAGPSARDREGGWDPQNARELMSYSAARGYPVDVWELGNEVNAFPLVHRLWLTPARYALDLGRARALIDELAPEARLGGPASAFWPVLGEWRPFLDGVLKRARDTIDVVSWHYYPQQSYRCPIATRRAASERMLSPGELADVDRWANLVEHAAGTHAAKAAVWLGETGSAQCGGEPGFSDGFADALWWADLLGRMARRGQEVLIRQTLAGSNYGLLDEESLTPNASYWASWLWRQLMDRRVLAVDEAPARATLRRYVHCARPGAPGQRPGAVTALLVNLDEQPAIVELPVPAAEGARVFLLTARDLQARDVALNGRPLLAAVDGSLPELAPLARGATRRGELHLPARSLAFAVLPGAGAPACH